MKYQSWIIGAIFLLTGCQTPVVATDTASTATLSSAPGISGPGTLPTASPTPSPIATNAPPTLTTPDQAGAEAGVLSFVLVAHDGDNDTLTYGCVSSCPVGMVVNPTTGAVNWTPGYGTAGIYHPLFGVSDAFNSQITQNVQISISHTNRAPVINAISSQNVNTGQTLNLTPVYSDPDSGDTLTLTMGSLPTNASFDGTSFHFSPDYTQAAQYTVAFHVSDGAITTSESVTITVNYQGTTPVMASIATQNVAQQQPISFTVSGSSADGASLTFSATGLPAGATFSGNQFNWTPSCGQNGTFTPTFTVTDSSDSLTDSKSPNLVVSTSDYYPVSWNTGVAPALSGTSGNSTNAYAGIASYLGGGSITYTYLAEYECNNKTWTKSFNASTRTFALTNPYGSLDPGKHSFLVAATDACGTVSYRFVQVTGYSASFSIQKVDLGSTYSTTGLCGGGTVYQH